jgi:squalene-associated FAD-dependent desaturase
MSKLRVAVVGGGLAGLAAALECAEAGAAVTLYEARARLGGATFSIRRNGYWLDNGQHVALRCCIAYRSFLRRLGVENRLELQPRLRVPVLAPGGRRAALERTALPAPFHLAGSLLRYRHLSLRDRVRAAPAVAVLRTLDPADRRLDAETFGAWLRRHGQSGRAVRAFWNLIALPTLNLPADDASLMLAAKVFRTGLLDDSDACDLALPSVPLQELHGDAAARALGAAGVRIELRAPVRQIVAEADALGLVLDAGRVPADRVIVAVPHDVAARLGLIEQRVADGLGASPIVNVHVQYDRRVLDEPFAAAVDSPVQWMFDRTAVAGVERGQLISISLSGARRELPLAQDELLATIRPELERLLPVARAASVLDATVTKEPRATFAGVPGTAPLRPGPAAAVAGVYLAGAWTDTGWPATMEGAVRSGVAAAAAALAEHAPRLPDQLGAAA